MRLLLSDTLERADGRGILWLPYQRGPKTHTREVALDASDWAVVGYSRAEALAERAVLPVTFLNTTGTRADDVYAFGPEAAGRLGPIYLEAVYQHIVVDVLGAGHVTWAAGTCRPRGR